MKLDARLDRDESGAWVAEIPAIDASTWFHWRISSANVEA